MYGQADAWRVPGYTELRELGSGGAGQVVLARHDADDVMVAIKYLSPELRSDPVFLSRFRHEAGLLSRMDVSSHVARFYEYVETQQGAAIVMEVVNGVSLRAMLRSQGPTGPEAALTILKGSLQGLAAAHGIGVVHRDYKPENIMITADGSSKIVDFGIATQIGEGARVSGSPPYMAPEQWAGAPAGPATDIYAATIVVFECITGTRPYRAQNLQALVHQHQSTPPPVDEVPQPLRGLIERGMAKHAAQRPSTAEAFLRELEAIAAEAYGPVWEERGKRRLAALAVLLLPFFPLAEEAPEVSSTMTETRLGGNFLGKASFKIGATLVGMAIIAGGTAALVNSMSGPTTLQAGTTTESPSAPASESPADVGATDPETPAPEDTDEPEETPTADPAATETNAPNPPVSQPTATSTPKASPSKKPTKKPSSSPKPKPSSSPEPSTTTTIPDNTPTATPTRPTTRPTPTRSTPTSEPSSPTTSPSNPPQINDAPVSTAPDAGAVPAGLLAVGLIGTGFVPAALAAKRVAGRHRRRR